jgi:hypothetical protein
MPFRHGNPTKFWRRVEDGFLFWETKLSPARWYFWRDVFWGREGFYVFLRGVILVLAGLIVGRIRCSA